jgi:ferredoxin-NADP reductase/MOSC domain-containing protein YiiM
MAQLLSVNVGLPRDIDWEGKIVRTAIWKSSVQGRRLVRRLNVEGDGQGDLAGHGGEHRAVFVYQTDSYHYWEKQLGRSDFTFGQFGENFTVDGLSDDEVCIGDRYRIGDALFEVTQPRVTCFRVGIRMNEPRMAALLVSHHRPGFYFRVLEEGYVGSEDKIVKVADGPFHMTVAEADELLYLPNHSRDQLRRALNIPALSPGWKTSFRAMLDKESQGGLVTGSAGLAPSNELPPAWPGFRRMRVSRMNHESSSVLSLVLEPTDGHSLSPALPGQFVVLRLHPREAGSPLLRSYSLSGPQNADYYRVSVKRETSGAASTYLHTEVRCDDVLEVSAPRGSFTLLPGDGPTVFISAGVGATPVLAMLHGLASQTSHREVWWLYGARNSGEHPFDRESRDLLRSLQHGRSYINYSRPLPADHLGADFDAPGHLNVAAIEKLAVPRSADFYLCGPVTFISDLTTGLGAWGVDSTRVHTEIFGPGKSTTPGISGAPARPPHPPAESGGSGPRISFARSGLTVAWDTRFQSLLELAEACDVPVRWSCRTGVCHTCETSLISGTVNYQPEPLQAPNDGQVLLCCCRPNDELVVDL